MQMSGVVKLGCRGLRLLSWLLLAWLASSCGGGTKQIDPFAPQQIVFVGDETVGLLPDGNRYGINGLNAAGTVDCGLLQIWSQQLAINLGFVVDFCGGGTAAITRATPGAVAADIGGQISAQFAATGVTPKDLYVVMVGMHDIIDLFENFSGDRSCDSSNNDPPAGSLMAELRARGALVAAQVTRIAAANGRTIVSTVHDLGYTPYAIVRNSQTLLSCMTAVFNARVRVDIRPQDGRFWGLVLADDTTVAIVRSPGSFGVTNTTDVACAAPQPDCTTATLLPNANTTYLWTDDLHFGPPMHNSLASGAITRARNNPF